MGAKQDLGLAMKRNFLEQPGALDSVLGSDVAPSWRCRSGGFVRLGGGDVDSAPRRERPRPPSGDS
eukprot:4798490-Pyramimonas_sp.AAC.1